MDKIINFKNVSLRYGEGPEVLKRISCVMPQGTFTFLTGPSGSGKTSLIKLIYGGEQPTMGCLEVFGQNVGGATESYLCQLRQKIGIISQEIKLLEHLTVFENISLPLRLAGMDIDNYKANVVELLEWTGLVRKMFQYPLVLSSGEKSLALLARAVIARPAILLADEPTANMDEQLATKLIAMLLQFNRYGSTVMVATHDISLVNKFDQLHISLEAGKLITNDIKSSVFFNLGGM